MNLNEQKFYDYWKEHLWRKTSAPTDKLVQAYYLLNGKHLTSSCSNCMSLYAQELKNVFNRLDLEKTNQQKIIDAEIDMMLLSNDSNEEFMRRVQEERDREELEKKKAKRPYNKKNLK